VDYALGDKAEGLRAELRTLLDEHVPEGYLSPFTRDPEAAKVSARVVAELSRREQLTLAWPKKYGGREADTWEQTVLREEMWAYYEPRGNHYLGLNWVGPAIMKFGTEEQRKLHLPRIASGEYTWCQGFSEPEAGTDLASLRTYGVRDDHGDWIVNGQKVWTSYAPMANWCMCAVRTDRDLAPRDGISLIMIPMDSSGLEFREIDSMLGHMHLNEVFLEDVHATDAMILGGVNRGWHVIRYALVLERVGIARYARSDRLLVQLGNHLGERYNELPEGLRARLARAAVHNRMARLLCYKAIGSQAEGKVDDVEAAAARIATVAAEQEVADLLMEAAGSEALNGEKMPEAPLGGAIEDFWRYTNASTVASGSIDVQRMHVARGALGSGSGGPSRGERS
jgi:alkylation response protein AidB-like acyl-CoA dehydrogenase